MNIRLRQAKNVLDKLRFEPLGQEHHSIMGFYYENKLLFKTRVSKGKGPMPKNVTAKFRTQIKLNEEQLRSAIQCPFKYNDYVKVLAEKGIIPGLVR